MGDDYLVNVVVESSVKPEVFLEKKSFILLNFFRETKRFIFMIWKHPHKQI